jgi:hypothetical protein
MTAPRHATGAASGPSTSPSPPRKGPAQGLASGVPSFGAPASAPDGPASMSPPKPGGRAGTGAGGDAGGGLSLELGLPSMSWLGSEQPASDGLSSHVSRSGTTGKMGPFWLVPLPVSSPDEGNSSGRGLRQPGKAMNSSRAAAMTHARPNDARRTGPRRPPTRFPSALLLTAGVTYPHRARRQLQPTISGGSSVSPLAPARSDATARSWRAIEPSRMFSPSRISS